MIKILFTLVLIFVYSLTLSQVRIVNSDLLNQDSSFLFRGVRNHCKIVGDSISELNLLAAKGARIFRKDYFSFQVGGISNDTVRISLGVMDNDEPKNLLIKEFYVVDIGEPIVELVEQMDTTYLNGQVMNWTRLNVKFTNPNYVGKWEVAHFEISLIDTNGNTILKPTFISGKFLTKDYNDKILELPIGSRISFTQIVIRSQASEYRKYSDINIIRQ